MPGCVRAGVCSVWVVSWKRNSSIPRMHRFDAAIACSVDGFDVFVRGAGDNVTSVMHHSGRLMALHADRGNPRGGDSND